MLRVFYARLDKLRSEGAGLACFNVPITSEFNEVAEGDLGKMRAEHFPVKFLLCLPTTERRRAQRGKIRRILSSEFGRYTH